MYPEPAKLSITPREGVKRPLSMNDLSVRLDGHEIRGLIELTLSLQTLEANVADMSIAVGEVEVDALVVEYLKAQVKQ